MLEPSVFELSQSEIDYIKQRMQDAVDGELIPEALILVGNSNGEPGCSKWQDYKQLRAAIR